MWLRSGVGSGCLHTLAATALIQPLACELPYAVGAALKRRKKKKKGLKTLGEVRQQRENPCGI